MDNLNEMWQSVLKELRNLCTDVVVNAWMDSLEPVNMTEENFVLRASSDFKKNIIEKRFSKEIEKAIENVVGFKLNVKIVTEGLSGINSDSAINNLTDGSNPNLKNALDCTFQNFIVGKTNQFAYIAAVAVAKNPGSIHNPLFIYGDSGLGKTHLLKGINIEISSTRPELKIIYTNGESFLNEMITHLSEKNMSEFHNKYRTCDVLLMDDIQMIGKSTAVQEEFFYTFEALINDGKQIVLVSDRPPKDIPTLEDRLRSRFIQGLLADIQPPMLETRIAIIRRKAELLNMKINDDVVQFIAERLKNNVRQIEGVVKKIYAVYQMTGQNPTIGIANDAIKDVIYYAQPTEVTINNIIEQVGKAFGVSPEDIKSDKKKMEISQARQVAMYVMREITNLTYEDIGKEFGGKKHSTVIYSLESAESKMEENPSLKSTVYDIMKNIKNERNE